MDRCPEVKITYYTKPVQEFELSFFAQFTVIIAGLDNVEARRWINNAVHKLVKFDDETDEPIVETVLIDGGTEGFSGQARVIWPFKDACYECTLSQLPPETGYPLCTIKETPRLPEHCIQYAYIIEWPEHFQRAMDKDSPDDMKWVCDRATIRA